jgi:hypothetical protein
VRHRLQCKHRSIPGANIGSAWDSRSKKIKQLIAIRRDKAHACAAVRQFLKAKLDGVTTKIREFQQLETELKADLGKCNRALRRQRGKTCACPVLEEIEQTNNA